MSWAEQARAEQRGEGQSEKSMSAGQYSSPCVVRTVLASSAVWCMSWHGQIEMERLIDGCMIAWTE